MNFEDFVAIYEKTGKCPGQMSKPKHTLNERELKTRYEKYIKPKKEKAQKGSWDDPLWQEVADKVWKRDKSQCRLLSKLKIDNPDLYLYFIKNNMKSLYTKLDLAHIIPRSQSRLLYYEEENLILLNRVSHSLLDSYHNPITGESIDKIQRDEWWEYIIGNELWKKLNDTI
jgi:5-methylcytosine-specific restriction endonuclease McrA